MSKLDLEIKELSQQVSNLDKELYSKIEETQKEKIKENRELRISVIRVIQANLAEKIKKLRAKLTEKALEIVKTSHAGESDKEIAWYVEIERQELEIKNSIFLRTANDYDDLLNQLTEPTEAKEKTEEENQWSDQRSNPAENPSDNDGWREGWEEYLRTRGNADSKTTGTTGGWFGRMKERITSGITSTYTYCYNYALVKPWTTGLIFTVLILVLYLLKKLFCWLFFRKKTGRPETIQQTVIRDDAGRFTPMKKK